MIDRVITMSKSGRFILEKKDSLINLCGVAKDQGKEKQMRKKDTKLYLMEKNGLFSKSAGSST